jgi:hypothetical protein
MKTIHILLLSILLRSAFGQEIPELEIKTEVKEVTVFIENAQITRTKTIDLMPGTSILKFVNLSPFIDSKSIQVKAKGEAMVLSVNHQQNFKEKSVKSNETADLQLKIKDIEDKIILENTLRSIVQEELAFLKENRSISGKTQEFSLENLKNTANYLSSQLTILNLKLIDHDKKLEVLAKQKTYLESQINTFSDKKEFPTGEILVKINSKKLTKVQLEITYITANAGWNPSYDLRATNINSPVELTYKANVHQDTKEDWKEVKLKLSSSNPSISGIAPELKTYFLDYYTSAPTYNNNINTVSGRILDGTTNEPIIGVNVVVTGTSIGTISDINGYYSISIPNNANSISYNFIGYNTEVRPINNSQMNISLQPLVMQLEEVVVAGYGSSRKKATFDKALQGRINGIDINDRRKSELKLNSFAIPMEQSEKQTAVCFDIKTPYTIKSDNQNYTINMEVYELPAFFKYYSVPKINNNAFLIAYITDWEKYNLLDGEANLFFEDTYVGKTLLDLRFATDTLSLSLGPDKNVTINRQKVKDFTTKQFIGSKKEETRAWLTSVKNNKSQKIDIIVLDQVPVSTNEEIEIEIHKKEGSQFQKETGEIKWEFTLEPGNKKELELRYSVKYPKNRNLKIE